MLFHILSYILKRAVSATFHIIQTFSFSNSSFDNLFMILYDLISPSIDFTQFSRFHISRAYVLNFIFKLVQFHLGNNCCIELTDILEYNIISIHMIWNIVNQTYVDYCYSNVLLSQNNWRTQYWFKFQLICYLKKMYESYEQSKEACDNHS